jgi:2-phospho-L-lactate guanylyltransferase
MGDQKRAGVNRRTMSGLWIVIPVKDTRYSKQRLADLLGAGERQALAHAMLDDVVEAVVGVSRDVEVALVTVDPYAREVAARHSFRVIDEGAHDGHTGAVDGGRHVLAAEGAAGILTMPGDIPLVTTAEIEALLRAHDADEGFTIVPAHDRQGSNAVACSPPERVPLRFGSDSFYPHLEAARRVGLVPQVVEVAGISTDVDTPEDVDRLLGCDPGRRSQATRLIESLDWAARRRVSVSERVGAGS